MQRMSPPAQCQPSSPTCFQGNFLPGFCLLQVAAALQDSQPIVFSTAQRILPGHALWARAQLVPRASPSPFQLPFGHRTVCPSSMFFTRVVIPLEASERGMPRGCSHSITEARKYHACPVY